MRVSVSLLYLIIVVQFILLHKCTYSKFSFPPITSVFVVFPLMCRGVIQVYNSYKGILYNSVHHDLFFNNFYGPLKNLRYPEPAYLGNVYVYNVQTSVYNY